MNLEIIDKIAWWIPFKNIRSKFRKQMIENNEKKLYI